MRFSFRLLLPAALASVVFSCKKDAANFDRPQDPWVFRSVLDSIPRIATVGLHDDMWVAYNTANCSVYKAWKGSVNFDGAVYTTAHGPQPSSIGNGWFVNKHDQPWLVVRGGKEEQPKVQYRGHRFEKGQATLNYELILADGKIIKIAERPEYATKGDAPNAQAGLERVFTTSGVPDGAKVVLKTNLSSVSLESAVETDGQWQVTAKADRGFGGLKGLDLDGQLTLKSNGSTRFAAFFTKKPMIENPNKIEGDEAAENLPLGLRLINKSDCKSCHNPTVQTVGPAYVDIARRYRNTADNTATLVGKVKTGGAGNWGQAAMTAHADLPNTDVEIMVKYIMALDSAEEALVANLPESKPTASAMSPSTAIKEDDTYPGAIVKVYQYDAKRGLAKVADLRPLPSPIFTGIVPQLHATAADLGELTDNFGIIAEGYLKVPKDNTYTFRTISDDGSVLYIGDQKIVDNDGLHGDEPKDGDVALKAGLHPFRLEYFEAGGGNMVSLQWKAPDGKFEVLPGAFIAHAKNDQPTTGGGMTLGAGSKIPGDKAYVAGVHPSYDLAQARPADFLPKVGGMDFLSDGRLVVCTWDAEGGVYVVENAQGGDPSKMRAKKIGNGLHEPLGLKVVNDVIYVLQKQELTKLVDNDKDGLIDEYYTVCNNWGVSSNFHEFAFGLVYKGGHFYGSLATDILPGGAGAPVQPKDRGRTFKISEKDGSIEFIASGLRTPNGIGIGVDGEIFNADNQGDWLPVSKILHITPGAFYGSRAVDFEGTANLTAKQPVVWLPQDEIGNSPATPLAFTDDSPYKGQMMHGEVTHGGIKRVFVEKVSGEYQGCLFRFTQGLEAGVNRLVWGPDGALYAGCIGNPGNWRDMNGEKLWYGLQRLKFNGKPTFEMLAVRAKRNGLEIEFTEPLEEGDGWNTAEYQVEQWRYVPTKEYGGPKVDQTKLKVLSASVSADRKRVSLELAGMKAGHVIYVRLPYYWASANGNELWTTEAWYTMNAVPAEPLTPNGAPAPVLAANTLTEAEKAAGWRLLFDGKTTAGWHGFNKKPVSKKWVVQDGTLHFDPKAAVDEKNGDLVTDEEFANYELRLEWKIAPCGNSGVIYNVVEDPKYEWGWQTGPEMQVLDNACHPDAMIEKHRAGDLYDLIASRLMTVKPAGQWNSARLVNRNGKVEHWLNGRKVVEADMTGEDWRRLIAGSKFKDMPDFGKKTSGRIMLQDHGDRVWYRNVKLRPLK
jgi:cytochrome c